MVFTTAAKECTYGTALVLEVVVDLHTSVAVVNPFPFMPFLPDVVPDVRMSAAVCPPPLWSVSTRCLPDVHPSATVSYQTSFIIQK